MLARLRLLFDLNIILDVLQRREPFYAMSARALASAETGQTEGLLAAHSITTLFYLVARGQSPEHARGLLADLLRFLTVASVDGKVIEGALLLPYRDFEDAVQMMAAVQAGATHLVTRNPQDFRAGPLPVLLPAELIALL
jgi:predicted nucleic acid-binding protein